MHKYAWACTKEAMPCTLAMVTKSDDMLVPLVLGRWQHKRYRSCSVSESARQGTEQ